ncbi:50S ribosomal protein L21, partial [Agathobacter rectalis]
DKQGKEKKVVTFKYKPKKHTHTKKGHRQPYTKVTIDTINA